MSMRKIYRQIARKHGVSVKEVRAQMQTAVDLAWTNSQKDEVTAAWQRQVDGSGRTPEVADVIRYAVDRASRAK